MFLGEQRDIEEIAIEGKGAKAVFVSDISFKSKIYQAHRDPHKSKSRKMRGFSI